MGPLGIKNALRRTLPADNPARDPAQTTPPDGFAPPATSRTCPVKPSAIAPPEPVERIATVALARAVATSRAASANGSEAWMSCRQATRAVDVIRMLSAAEKARVDSALSRAQSWAEQALLLKALAARTQAMRDPTARLQALGEVLRFADAIRGVSPNTLAQQTTLIDVDETRDTLALDPLARTRAGAQRELAATNDGLYQRYVMSCGPGSIEVLLGEMDPIYAWARRHQDFGVNPRRAVDLQTDILRRYGETPDSLSVPHHVERIRRGLQQLVTAGTLDSTARDALEAHVLNDAPLTLAATGALAALRHELDGFPDDAMLRTIRDYQPPQPGQTFQRIGPKNIEKTLNDYVGGAAGVEYRLVSLYDEAAGENARAASPDFVRRALPAAISALRSGVDILFGTSNPDHFWSISATRDHAGATELLIHDTWSGATRWITTDAFASGRFHGTFAPHQHGAASETYVDWIYLPR